MAETPQARLAFDGGCPDCGSREVVLPAPLPEIGDDFDWRVRDFDSFRAFMLRELAARHPERTRWTPADLEVVIVELFAAVLDQLSDMADRVAAESYLQTARRPQSVLAHLELIGDDAVEQAVAAGHVAKDLAPSDRREALLQYWGSTPSAMDVARRRGPYGIHTQKRMASLEDYGDRLEEHPLVKRASASWRWSGAWSTIRVGVILLNNEPLDEEPALETDVQKAITELHEQLGIRSPEWPEGSDQPSLRSILRPYVDALRMVGQEVLLLDASQVGIHISLTMQVAPNYFRSEVRRAVAEALGTGPGGFFEAGRLRFGEDVHASDVFETVMRLDGVEHVCLNRFKKLGRGYPDRSEIGRIELDGLEVARCDSNPKEPRHGILTLRFHGGRRG
ncbi:MAG: hypothetical protein GY715_04015 [Planctomycetes bacterium]|nr:hypothetical protein [Planctomycetota bacterium]